MNWRKEDCGALRERLAQWRSRAPECHNVFREPEETWEIAEADGATFFRAREHAHFRLYFFAESFSALTRALASLDAAEYVVNVPARGDAPESLRGALEGANFREIARYRRMFFPRAALLGVEKADDEPEFAKDTDSEKIHEELLKTFSVRTDYVPEKTEWRKIVEERRVLVRRASDGNVRACAAFSRVGRKIVLNFWFATGGGTQVLRDLMRLAAKEGAALQFWVRDGNARAISRYLAHGAQFDGLNDLSFLRLPFPRD